jgi:hypothetical protein
MYTSKFCILLKYKIIFGDLFLIKVKLNHIKYFFKIDKLSGICFYQKIYVFAIN